MAVFNEPSKWQTSLVNNGDANTIPQNTPAGTGEASFEDGFPQITQVPIGAGGIAPDRKDFNGLFKILGDWIFFLQNGGLSTYSANFDYVVGRYVVYNNTLYKCIQANGASSTVVAPDSVSPLGSDYWKDIENQDSTSLIPNQIIQSPVPLTDANLHLLDGALLSGSGVYADYIDLMQALYESDPTLECFTDEATWQASVTAYGVCGKFVWDSVNDTLRLPKITGFIEGTNTASELGSLTEAGAPNITGGWKGDQTYNAGLAIGSTSPIPNGCVSFEYENCLISNSDSSGNYVKTVKIDASTSSAVYGNSNTIQPQSIKQYFYIVVGTISKTEIQIDIDQYLADLALKADTSLSNLDATGLNRFANPDFSNVSATGKATSIGWGIPDYSRAIDITASLSTTATSITVAQDSYIKMKMGYGGSSAWSDGLNVDGVGFIEGNGFAGYQIFVVPIAKGTYSMKLLYGSNTQYVQIIPCAGE